MNTPRNTADRPVVTLTQAQRIERVARQRGSHGFTVADFASPDVVDGGPPILRVAARVAELRSRGVPIVQAGRRGGLVIYQLPPDHYAPIVSVPTSTPALFAPPPVSPYEVTA